MVKVTDISELISLVCKKLIEYGVQPHTVWSDYSYNYRPILHFFQEHECPQYDEALLAQYRQEQQKPLRAGRNGTEKLFEQDKGCFEAARIL